MSDELNRNEVDAYAIGYYHGRIGDLPSTIHGQDTAVFAAYTKGFDAGMKAYEEEYQPVPVSDKQERLEADGWQFGDAEDFLADDLLRFEQNAWKSGYHHALTGSDAYNVYREGTMAHALYDEGYEVGLQEYNAPADEDFPEHEGLDNQDHFADMPDEVILDDDEVAARVAEHWNLDWNQNGPPAGSKWTLDDVKAAGDHVKAVAEKWTLDDAAWDDDHTPIITIQIKDGGVWEAFATAPVRLYIMDEDTPDAEVPEGLTLDEQGTLNYASKWARGNVQFEN